MLVIGRKIGEFLVLTVDTEHGTEYIRVAITKTGSDRGRIAVEASENVIIYREELLVSEEQKIVHECLKRKE